MNDASWLCKLVAEDGETPQEGQEVFSEGKSGAFLYFTHDRQCMLKQSSYEDFDSLMQLMTSAERRRSSGGLFGTRNCPQSLLEYVLENPLTTLTRFLGCYSVKLSWIQEPIVFIACSNVHAGMSGVHHFFSIDVKGSSLGRQVLQGTANLPHGTLKDRDLKTLREGGHLKDKKFSIGIIDILQRWNAKKKGELVLKNIRYCCGLWSCHTDKADDNDSEWSCVSPKYYALRFMWNLPQWFALILEHAEYKKCSVSTSCSDNHKRLDVENNRLDLQAGDIKDQIQKDCEFLLSHGIMDYSLLIGVFEDTQYV